MNVIWPIVAYLLGCGAAFYVGAIIGVKYGTRRGADKAFAIHLATLKEYARTNFPDEEERNSFFLRMMWASKMAGAVSVGVPNTEQK